MHHRKTNLEFPIILLLIFCGFHFQHTNAQERRSLKGKVITDSLNNLKGIHVVNLTGELGTTTNEDGDFDILAKNGDTLFFSSVQFMHEKIVVRESSFDELLMVRLREKFNELDEVQLDNIKLSGVLSGDIDKVPKSIYEKVGWSFPKPRRSSLELAVQSATGNGPLLSVINRLNGTTERLEKAEKNTSMTLSVNKGLALVGKPFFINQLNIDENEILNFLFYCADDPEYSQLVYSESIMKLLELLEGKIVSFKELRELD